MVVSVFFRIFVVEFQTIEYEMEIVKLEEKVLKTVVDYLAEVEDFRMQKKCLHQLLISATSPFFLPDFIRLIARVRLANRTSSDTVRKSIFSILQRYEKKIDILPSG